MAQVADPVHQLLHLSAVSRLLSDFGPNVLYVLPVGAVLILCLLVYAFGFKSSPLPPSLRSSSQKERKKTGSKKRDDKGSKLVASTASAGDSAPKSKPKAVVRPMKQELRSKKQKDLTLGKRTVNLLKEPVELPDPEDEDSGEWVAVLSDKTKKKAQKLQKQESAHKSETGAEAVVIAPAVTAAIEPVTEKKTLASVDQQPVEQKPVDQQTVTEDWDVEEPIEGKESQVRAKKKNKRGKESRSELLRQSAVPAAVAVPDQTAEVKVFKDKLTSEILAKYDSVPEVDKSQTKKRKEKSEKRGKVPNTGSQKEAVLTPGEPKENTTVKVASIPLGTEPVEQPDIKTTTTSSSDAADVTDATGSEPSDGEFKVVRKRKARRE